MTSGKWSTSTIWMLWLFTLVLYGMFVLSAEFTRPPLPAIILSVWLGSTLLASVITWSWMKGNEKDEADK